MDTLPGQGPSLAAQPQGVSYAASHEVHKSRNAADHTVGRGVIARPKQNSAGPDLDLDCAKNYPCWPVPTRWTGANWGVHAELTDLPYDPYGQTCANQASTSFTWSIVSQPTAVMTLKQAVPGPGATENDAYVTNANNPPTFPAGGGIYEVLVQCDATYTTPCGYTVTATNSTPVDFFVIVPKKVVLVTAYPPQPPNNGKLGHDTNYDLEVRDNSDSSPFTNSGSQPYSNGLPREEFANPSDPNAKLNYGLGGSTWGLNLEQTGNPFDWIFDGTGNPTADFTDTIGYEVSPPQPPDPPYDPAPLWVSFDQIWHCMELIPPTSPPRDKYIPPDLFGRDGTQHRNPSGGDFLANVNDTTLNTHHIDDYHDHDTRTGDINP